MKNPKFNLGKEVLASFVVFLVALTLSMGIAVACGVPTHKGLLTGVIGGLVVAPLAGCRLQVSGPAAGLTVTVAELVQNHGLSSLGPIVAAAGLIQLIAGYLRLGRWFLAVSPAVVRGMLTAIGVMIAVAQLYIVLDQKPFGSALQNIIGLPGAFIKAFSDGGAQHQLAAMIGAITIACMVGWKFFKLDKRLYIPEAVPAILLGSVIAAIFGLAINKVSIPDSLSDMVTPLSMGQITGFDLGALKMALVLALIASAETLLSAASVDQLAPGERTDYDKDLRAHGWGNMVCGFLGSLPLTGVIVRSKTNIEAGAKTRWSSFMHGCWLLLAVAALPWLLAHIPTCTLAALLVVTGFKLVDRTAFRDLLHYGWGESAIFVVTAVLIVCTDLLIGVGIGFGLAALRMMWKVLHVHVVIEQDGDSYHVYLQGAAMFLVKPIIDKQLAEIPQGAVVHLHLDGLTHMDHACLDMLAAWACCREKTGDSVFAERGPASTQVHSLEDLRKLWLKK